jgi:hypothetical protein
MPYEINVAQGLVHWTHTGDEPPGAWTHTLDQIVSDPLFTSGFHILEDLRADPDLPALKDIHKGVATILAQERRLGCCRWAVVLRTGSPALYGMLRMAELILEASSVTLRPFTDVEGALDWLGASR